MKPVSRLRRLAYGSVPALVIVFGIVPWTVVAAQAPAADRAPEKTAEEALAGSQGKEPEMSPVVSQEGSAAEASPALKTAEEKVQSGGGRGKFVSFQGDTLTIRANDGVLIRNKLPESTKTFQWHDEGGFKPAETVATLDQVKAGTWIHILIEKGNTTIRIGARKAQTVGSFVSFKDNRLLILGKSLGESYVKKYGNQVHFNKFRADVEAYESVDGGDYQLVGLANNVLANVKEGTIITVHGEGDDNITLVQIGVPAKK